jgi:hypothetical protein
MENGKIHGNFYNYNARINKFESKFNELVMVWLLVGVKTGKF